MSQRRHWGPRRVNEPLWQSLEGGFLCRQCPELRSKLSPCKTSRWLEQTARSECSTVFEKKLFFCKPGVPWDARVCAVFSSKSVPLFHHLQLGFPLKTAWTPVQASMHNKGWCELQDVDSVSQWLESDASVSGMQRQGPYGVFFHYVASHCGKTHL